MPYISPKMTARPRGCILKKRCRCRQITCQQRVCLPASISMIKISQQRPIDSNLSWPKSRTMRGRSSGSRKFKFRPNSRAGKLPRPLIVPLSPTLHPLPPAWHKSVSLTRAGTRQRRSLRRRPPTLRFKTSPEFSMPLDWRNWRPAKPAKRLRPSTSWQKHNRIHPCRNCV